MNKSLFSALFAALLAGPGLAVGAQTNAEAKPVTLNISQVSLQTALKLLFAGSGIRRYSLAPDVPRGAAVGSLSLNGVPFAAALKQVLGTVNPPLIAELQGGIYRITTQASAPLGLETSTSFSAAEDSRQTSFYKIGIRHYDAGVIADAMTRRDGIILLPPNFVVPSAFGASASGPAAPNVTAVGAGSGQTAPLGAAVPPGAAVPITGGGSAANGPAANNVLPDGVKRIFVLQSDNSLVIEATPRGYDNLTGTRLLAGGYTQVY